MTETNDSTLTILKKGLTYNGNWDKDTFIDYNLIIYWLRQIIGLIIGIICGILPLTNIFGFLLFGIVNVAVPYFYYTNYSKINIDDFGALEMLGEGFSQSFGVFLLSWIIVYSGIHFP